MLGLGLLLSIDLLSIGVCSVRIHSISLGVGFGFGRISREELEGKQKRVIGKTLQVDEGAVHRVGFHCHHALCFWPCLWITKLLLQAHDTEDDVKCSVELGGWSMELIHLARFCIVHEQPESPLRRYLWCFLAGA